MNDAIACTAQFVGAIAFVFAICSGLNDSRSLVAAPLLCLAGVCVTVTIICWRIVA